VTPIHPGDLVRLRHATSLGEMPVTRIEGAVIYVDTGHRIDDHVVPVGYERSEVIAGNDWPAEAKRRRMRREALQARHDARKVH